MQLRELIPLVSMGLDEPSEAVPQPSRAPMENAPKSKAIFVADAQTKGQLNLPTTANYKRGASSDCRPRRADANGSARTQPLDANVLGAQVARAVRRETAERDPSFAADFNKDLATDLLPCLPLKSEQLRNVAATQGTWAFLQQYDHPLLLSSRFDGR